MPLRNTPRNSPCGSTRCAEMSGCECKPARAQRSNKQWKAGVNYSRREFVKQSASALIVGLTLKDSVLQVFAVQESTTRGALPPPRSVPPEELDSWLAISNEGKVT